jgi:DNA-binding SARP family transcriptional activator
MQRQRREGELARMPRLLTSPQVTVSPTPEAPAVVVCVLGCFRILKTGQPVQLRAGAKGEQLLVTLALGPPYGVPRDEVLARLWPDTDIALAAQSLNTVVYTLHRLLGGVLGGQSPVVFDGGTYRLHRAAGVAVDTALFDRAVQAGHARRRADEPAEAVQAYERATELYRGDLCVASDTYAVIERERLRAQYMNALVFLANHQFALADLARTLEYAHALLRNDPCREDAHRLVMRCYVRSGDRSQALRQYRVCAALLRSEFDAIPEPATTELFDLLRTQPGCPV